MTSRQDVQKRRAWEVRLGRFRASGLTVERFCEQEGVSTHTFYYWAKRVGSAAGTPPRSTGGLRARSRQSVPHNSAGAGNPNAALVRFHWNAAVEVSVPADCLNAIRCLAECLQRAQVESAGAFQEVVMSS